MYVKHFFKMLLGLIVMALIGVAGLLIINHYSKSSDSGDAKEGTASTTVPN